MRGDSLSEIHTAIIKFERENSGIMEKWKVIVSSSTKTGHNWVAKLRKGLQ